MLNELPGERPARPAPISIFQDAATVRRVHWLNNRANKFQRCPLFSVADLIRVVIHSASRGMVLENNPGLVMTILAHVCVGIWSFKTEEAVYAFGATFTSEIFRLRAADPRLLGNQGGTA